MPSDSPLQAVVEYCRSKTVSGSPVLAYRDTATGEESNVKVVPPYVVVFDDGGAAIRDTEGNEFGPLGVRVVVYAPTPELARLIFDTVVYAAQPPDDRQGIEAAGAVLPYLTGFSQAEVRLDRKPQEGRARARNVTALQHTVSARFQVYTTRS